MPGYQADELAGLDIQDLDHPQDRGLLREWEIDRLRCKDAPSVYEARLLGKNGDSTQLHQKIMNLCTHAARAMREAEGTLSVSMDLVEPDSSFVARHPELRPGVYTKITFADAGHGMPPHIFKMIFEPYFTTK